MFYIYHMPMLPAAIYILVLVVGTGGALASANEIRVTEEIEEHRIEFYNHDVKLAGSLLLPKSERPLPAVVFVHGAGPQTREHYRKQGEYFASQGIAALIYDKRGTGESGGAYESRKPYENLVNDALAGVAFLKLRGEVAPSQIGMWGLSQGGSISAAAASRSKDIRFIVAVGSEVADGMLYYYRDNLFRGDMVCRTRCATWQRKPSWALIPCFSTYETSPFSLRSLRDHILRPTSMCIPLGAGLASRCWLCGDNLISTNR